jgi:hypothetical protein
VLAWLKVRYDFERVSPHPKEKEGAGSRTAGLLVLFFALQRKEQILNDF